jgi:hypothetical protein
VLKKKAADIEIIKADYIKFRAGRVAGRPAQPDSTQQSP